MSVSSPITIGELTSSFCDMKVTCLTLSLRCNTNYMENCIYFFTLNTLARNNTIQIFFIAHWDKYRIIQNTTTTGSLIAR